MNNAVVCSGVEKWFGANDTRIQVLRELDLTIKMGELAMLVGPSGCGKTTLISVIAGLLDATAGEVEVLGERPKGFTPQEQILFRRENLGFVFQQFNLLPALTAAENAAVPLLAAPEIAAPPSARAARPATVRAIVRIRLTIPSPLFAFTSTVIVGNGREMTVKWRSRA